MTRLPSHGEVDMTTDVYDTDEDETPNYTTLAGQESSKFADAANKHHTRQEHFRAFRSASLSVSMLAKPSDDRKASSFLSGWNVSNLIQGTGILGVPYAVQQGGWASVGMILFVAFLCCHTGKLLIDCMYETSQKTNIRRRLRVNYPEVGEKVFGRRGHTLISIIQVIEMFGAVVMYLVVLGTAWEDLLGKISHLDVATWTVINAAVVLPSLFITKMSIISWLSMISVFSLLSALLALMAFCFTKTSVWSISNIPPFNPSTFPIGFGIIVFSYCAHAVFPSIEGSMKKPHQFNAMMNTSFLLAAVVKACLGTFMVLTFGAETDQVATVNLKDDPVFSVLTTALVISNVLLAVPLGMFVASLTFDEAMLKHFPHLNRDSNYHWAWLLISRPLLLTFALLLAVVVPHFGLLMGFIGSFTGTALCFIFPCWCHMKLRWNSLKRHQIGFEMFIMVFGLVAGGFGLVFSAKALVESYL